MIETADSLRFLDTVAKGGWIMIPLGLCSFIAFAIIIEKTLWGPKRTRILPEAFVNDVRTLIQANKFEEIIGLCRASDFPIARIVLASVKNIGKPQNQILEATRTAGKREALLLQKYTGTLGTIAVITPLLGLLGTVFGMIETFSVIEQQGVGNASALSGGIAEALITTATGLSVAIPSLVFYRFYLHQVRTLVTEMEGFSVEILDKLTLHKEKEGVISLSEQHMGQQG